jgi:hypothetical protein
VSSRSFCPSGFLITILHPFLICPVCIACLAYSLTLSSSSLLSLTLCNCQHSVAAHYSLMFQVPLFIPVLVIAVALFLCLVPIITEPSPRYFIAPAVIVLACILYVPLIHYKFRPEWISKYFYW